MKNISGNLGCLLIGSLFTGLMFAVAIGSIFPVVNKIAVPIVCGNGTFEIQRDTYYYQGMDIVTTEYCTRNGVKQEVTLITTLVAGLIDSVAVFVVASLVSLVSAANNKARTPLASSDKMHVQNSIKPNRAIPQEPSGEQGGESVRRLRELKAMLDSQLITEQEFEQKKKDILEEI
jgi:hypothetical protein